MGIDLIEFDIISKAEIPRSSRLGPFHRQMLELRQESFTLREIALKFGCSRERVRQILAKYGMIKPELLSQAQVAGRIGCSGDLLTTLRRKGVVNPKWHGWSWLYDTDELNKARLAVEAYHQQHKPVTLKPVTLRCEQCGKEFTLRQSEYNARLRRRKIQGFFCSRQCYGQYIAVRYGFTVHPEHARFGPLQRKWDYSKVYSLWEETRWSLSKLSQALGIPLPSIASILQKYPPYKSSSLRPVSKKLSVPYMPLSPELKLYHAIFGEKVKDCTELLLGVYEEIYKPKGKQGRYTEKCIDWVTAILNEARDKDTEAIKEPIHNMLSSLTEREKRVLWLRFGFHDGRSRTLEEVGKEFYVTRERIRQIEAKALRKLRRPSQSRLLRDYLDQNHYQLGQYLRNRVFEECDKTLNPPGLFVLWQEDRCALKEKASRQIYVAEEEVRRMKAEMEGLKGKAEKLESLVSTLPYFKPVAEVGLSNRVVNALRRGKRWIGEIPTVIEVALLSDDQLLNIPAIGNNSFLEIKEALEARGIAEWQWQLFTSRFSKIIPVQLKK